MKKCHGLVLNSYIHPKMAGNAWKILQRCTATDDILRCKGFKLVSRCALCKRHEESLDHVLWECRFATQICRWIVGLFETDQSIGNFRHAIAKFRLRNPFFRHLWTSCVISMMVSIWKHRNNILFEGNTTSISECRQMIRRRVLVSAVLLQSKGFS